ncbi:MAG: lipopolysaccharide assembly protein LapA domain-containing protein [Arenimonas sp.]
MRVIKALVALCFVAMGLAFGALNRGHVTLDLGVATAHFRLGLLLLMVLLAGALVGGLVVMAGVVWPLRRRLHPASGNPSGPDSHELAQAREPRP